MAWHVMMHINDVMFFIVIFIFVTEIVEICKILNKRWCNKEIFSRCELRLILTQFTVDH